MLVVAGPPGSGKSSFLSVHQTGADSFNVDDRCAELNGGSYQGIPPEIRAQANQECEAFIHEHIRDRRSFAVETTLRTDITFRQAQGAKEQGFETVMEFTATGDVEMNIRRIALRLEDGGHGAPPARIRSTYLASLMNLPRALREFNVVRIYDNSGTRPRRVLSLVHGRVTSLARNIPTWLKKALRGSDVEHLLQRPAGDEV